jgi:hypothetical protein
MKVEVFMRGNRVVGWSRSARHIQSDQLFCDPYQSLTCLYYALTCNGIEHSASRGHTERQIDIKQRLARRGAKFV